MVVFCFNFSVVNHLLKCGDKQDDSVSNSVRQKAFVLLCRMQPSQTLDVRNKCIDQCKMPSLAVALTLGENLKKRVDRQESTFKVSFPHRINLPNLNGRPIRKQDFDILTDFCALTREADNFFLSYKKN